eukprot:1600511-Pleurochrysis_carterae.AAC.1
MALHTGVSILVYLGNEPELLFCALCVPLGPKALYICKALSEVMCTHPLVVKLLECQGSTPVFKNLYIRIVQPGP